MPDHWTDTFNVIANLATILGGAFLSSIVIYLLLKVRKIAERLESVLAPKTGIEGFLNMCAQAVECDPDGTCIVDDNGGEIVLVNKRMEEISGYHRTELVGKTIEILVPDVAKSEHPHHREGFVVGPMSRPMRGLKLRHKRGWELTVGINLNHYVDASGGYTIAKVRVPERESDWRRQSGEMPRMSE